MFEFGGITIAEADARIAALRPQGTAALTIAGSGDSLTAAPTFTDANIYTVSNAGNLAVDVAALPDGATGQIRCTPDDTKTVTVSATGGTIERQGGLDLNPITGDGASTWTIWLTRSGTVYEMVVVVGEAYS